MDYQIKGRRALVAGSSAGIGKACAAALAREGADVFLVARNEQTLAEAAEELREAGGRVGSLAVDLSIDGECERVVAAASSFLGGIDILVNNAGGPKPGTFATLEDDDWLRAFKLNLMSAVRLTRGSLPGMIEQRWGRIVNITSTSIKQPIDGLMLSNAMRMAVAGFAKTLSNEVGPFGITVNTVAPGFTDTGRLAQIAENTAAREGSTIEALQERWRGEVPLRRIGKADEVAAAVLFLASEAGSYVNGVVLAVDGGRTKSSL
ncbi:MAG TPA: SDR family oxidoreductase [Thermoanaerobaculia bacterium]|nr:SDR family oxidoreductase [Thermoanaerobaculia bacterium]